LCPTSEKKDTSEKTSEQQPLPPPLRDAAQAASQGGKAAQTKKALFEDEAAIAGEIFRRLEWETEPSPRDLRAVRNWQECGGTFADIWQAIRTTMATLSARGGIPPKDLMSFNIRVLNQIERRQRRAASA
jgi:hypothetical protein